MREPLTITRGEGGLELCGLQVIELEPGEGCGMSTGEDEVIVLPLGGRCDVRAGDERFALAGRASVFEAVSDFAYVPCDAELEIESASGGRFALASARATRQRPARHVAAADVPIELRGAGQASRQVNNFGSPETLDADRLIAVEVLTPGGNWSSYPPHKHDEEIPGVETALEEIYYFEVARGGFALPARLRRRDRHLPRGAHGRCRAAAARLPRPVDGGAGVRPVLPERDGRARRARVALPRRPGPRLDPQHVGGAGDRSQTSDDGGPMRLTVAQALVRFLANQHTERDGLEQRLIAGCFGIFGHGNVAGIGQALLEQPEAMPYYHARNEQGMVHAAAGYARMKNRLSTLACTSSIGPGATNMVTGAALATINRLPVLLLPGDIFATRVALAGAAGARGPDLLRRVGQRRLPAGVALLGPDQPARAAAVRAAGRDAGADRSGRDRRRDALAAPGRPGRGVRLAGGAVRAARVARAAPGARARRWWPRRRRGCAPRGGR